jgi:hypothetical protein
VPWAAATAIRCVLSRKSCVQVSSLTANEKAVLESGTERVNRRAKAEEKEKEKGYMGIQPNEQNLKERLIWLFI